MLGLIILNMSWKAKVSLGFRDNKLSAENLERIVFQGGAGCLE